MVYSLMRLQGLEVCLPSIGSENEEWGLELCHKKWRDQIVTALQKALPSISIEEA